MIENNKEFLKFSDCTKLSSKVALSVIKLMDFKITNFIKEPHGQGRESFVWIAYPHTSNWDTFMGYLSLLASETPFFIIVKDLYGHPIFKPLTKIAHLFPIKRDSSSINSINKKLKEENSCIVMVPEGTRKLTNGWKTGFHHIAVEHNLRILPTYICYDRKILVHNEPIEPGSNAKETIQKCKEIYDREKPIGKYPHLANPIKIFSKKKS
jgi:1-acyl-sn-glycerol-3-phosphate acyltransferase